MVKRESKIKGTTVNKTNNKEIKGSLLSGTRIDHIRAGRPGRCAKIPGKRKKDRRQRGLDKIRRRRRGTGTIAETRRGRNLLNRLVFLRRPES